MTLSRQTPDQPLPEIRLALDTICHIISKAREFDAKGGSTNPDASSTEDDDVDAAMLEDRASDSVLSELTSVISDLSDGAQIDLVALMWLGRDGASPAEWDETRQTAADEHNAHTARYLCGTPLLADYLEEGLSAIGRDCSDFTETSV